MPYQIETAVKRVAEKQDRSKNVIIYGVKEIENEKLREKVEEVLDKIGEKPLVMDCVRVG